MSESRFLAVLHKKRILIIDDDPVLLKGLSSSFVAAGCSVMTAAEGTLGLRRFADARPDLVVTDILMPGREGVETIVAMKREDAAVPIIAISGGGQIGASEILSLALRVGADAALAKPFRSQELLTTAGSILDQASKAA